jgi:cellulose synthase operon protein B
MRRFAAALALSVLIAAPAFAQQGNPFDMGTERRQQGMPDTPAQPAPVQPAPTAPAPSTPVRPPNPAETPRAATPAPSSPAAPRTAAPAAQPARPVTPTPAHAQVGETTARRYLVPFSDLRLNGEIEQRAWSIHLTAEQAEQGARLHAAYQNSVFVAPETSRLTITINDVPIASEPISSSEQVSERGFDIPAGVLKAGANIIRFGASQRHRTDCTIESTYELWTQIDPQRTYISFGGPVARQFGRLDDLRAVGVDGQGRTRFRIIAPSLDQLGATDTLMRLAQGLALVGGMPNQSFTFRRQADGDLQPGEIAVFVGTSEELRAVMPSLNPTSDNAAVASFVDYPGTSRTSALVLSGPSWPAIAGLIDSFVASLDGTSTQRREMLATDTWRGMDTPFLFSDTTLDFASLGVPSQEFSGRLFRTNFTIGVPADFYANAYGEAQILLDAAYVPDVLPGSHIDIFVNGNIASTVPITSSGGAVLRQLPIKLTLRHFRPGVNTITIEAALRTASDASCAPGTIGEERPRFALFGTSQFHMPDFARIAQVPNVAATAGIGFPYFLEQERTSLFLGRIDEPTLSAAATFLGKIATASHRVIPLDVTISAARIAGRNAFFVGAISDVPQNILSQLKIDQDARNNWSPDTPGHPISTPGLSLQDWQQRAGSNFIGEQLTAVSDWAKENFDLSLSTLRFAPTAEDAYKPPRSARLLVAQESDPTNTGTWTAVLAPDSATLEQGMRDVSARQEWEKLHGSISIYSGPQQEMGSLPVNWFRFMPTHEITLGNARLIAANWLSDNIMSYALLLVAGSILLGLATGGLLSLLGRR